MAKFDGSLAIKHLREKWTGRPCPMCGAGNWNVNDSTFQLTEFNQGSVVIGGPVIPLVAATCSNCGNTVLINAIIARIVKPEPGAKQ